MNKIAICICTRNRQEGLINLLNSIEKLKIESASIKVIVVENNIINYSEYIVNAFSSRSRFEIRYFLETQQGLVYARNRSVKEAGGSDFCCFVDDDQKVAEDWILELLRCQKEFNADGVWGSNPPVFKKNVHSSVKKFFIPHSCLYEYGAIVNNAYTNCLLLKKKYLDKIYGPFDIRLNFCGGEDIFLTSEITKLGGIIRNNPDAIAYEIIPNERTIMKYILKRVFRNSNTSYFVQSISEHDFNKITVSLRLILRLGLGILIFIPLLLFGKDRRLDGIIKIFDSLGGFAFIFGLKNQFYK